MKTKIVSKNKKSIQGSVILITGGTGSFGNAVLDHLIDKGCAEIRVFSRDEKKQYDMFVKYNNPMLKYYIGDVRDKSSIMQAMHGVDFVFHAAALKQVPTGELFPDQVVKTNILGSANVMEAAGTCGVKSVICLSTDKAVMPVNAMGMSKALMEKHLHAMVRTKAAPNTTFALVRYGNVMCSRGSVIPLFISQIKKGKSITLTDGSMTRFMLPLSEAVSLVLFAMEHAKSGDLFVRKSPACTVTQLARVLSKIFHASTEIKTIGIRLGEKIDETLASSSEMARSVEMGDYLRVPLETEDIKHEKYFSEGSKHATELNSKNTVQLNDNDLENLLRSLPEVQTELNNGIQMAS